MAARIQALLGKLQGYIFRAIAWLKSRPVPDRLAPAFAKLKGFLSACGEYATKALLWLRADRRRLYAFAAAAVLAAVAVPLVAWWLRPYYQIDSSIKNFSYFFEPDAEYYVEFTDPARSLKDFENSQTGREIRSSAEWNRLLSLPEALQVSSLLYFLEVRAGLLQKTDELESLTGGPVALALFADDRFVAVAKTSLKSRLGIGLIQAFKSDSVAVPDVSSSSRSNDPEVVTADSYRELYRFEKKKLGNINIQKLLFGKTALYFCMLDDTIFVSNQIDRLQNSLGLATKKSLNSLGGTRLMQKSLEAHSKSQGQVLLYMKPSRLAARFVVAALTGWSEAAISLKPGDSALLEGSLYLGGDVPASATARQNFLAIANTLPHDLPLVVMAGAGLPKTSELFAKSQDAENAFGEFLTKSKLDGIEKESFFVVLHEMTLQNKMLYPRFSLGSWRKGPDPIAPAVFKTVVKSGKACAIASDCLEYGGRKFYKPFRARLSDILLEGSHIEDLESFTATQEGNRPALSDIKTVDLLDDYARAPHHFIAHIPAVLDALDNWFLYGAKNSSRYSETTIDRDIRPLFMPFRSWRTLHLASNREKQPHGKIYLIAERE